METDRGSALQTCNLPGVLQPGSRVGLPFVVDEAGMKAKFRKKLRSLAVSVPVLRDLRGSQPFPTPAESDAIVVQDRFAFPTPAESDAIVSPDGGDAKQGRDDGGGVAAAGASWPPPAGAPASDAGKRGVNTSEADAAAAARRVPSMAAGLEDEDAPLEDPQSPLARAPADVPSSVSSDVPSSVSSAGARRWRRQPRRRGAAGCGRGWR